MRDRQAAVDTLLEMKRGEAAEKQDEPPTPADKPEAKQHWPAAPEHCSADSAKQDVADRYPPLRCAHPPTQDALDPYRHRDRVHPRPQANFCRAPKPPAGPCTRLAPGPFRATDGTLGVASVIPPLGSSAAQSLPVAAARFSDTDRQLAVTGGEVSSGVDRRSPLRITRFRFTATLPNKVCVKCVGESAFLAIFSI
jgi:hypothetical protein